MEPLFFSLIKITFTIGLLLVAAIILLKVYNERQKQPAGNPTEAEEKKILLPLRLQAYERLIMFLERINPGNLVMRLNRPDMTAIQFQSLLVRTIREEFEYNLSQQLYTSSKAWELVKNAKEETISLVNQASAKLPENASSAELARIFFDQFLNKDKSSVDLALDELKQEIRKSL